MSPSPPSPALAAAHAAVEDAARKSAAWLAGQYRHGVIPPCGERDGIIPPAEKIVLDCLRALQSIPDADRLYADRLMDAIAQGYLETALDPPTSRRRVTALLRIAGEAA
jgi:hypothetical protein